MNQPLCRHGSLKVAVSTAEQVAHADKRRAMLLVAAAALAERGEPETTHRTLGLLPDRHPAVRLLDLRPGKAVRATALGNLGNVRVREAVTGWLDLRFAKPAKGRYRPAAVALRQRPRQPVAAQSAPRQRQRGQSTLIVRLVAVRIRRSDQDGDLPDSAQAGQPRAWKILPLSCKLEKAGICRIRIDARSFYRRAGSRPHQPASLL